MRIEDLFRQATATEARRDGFEPYPYQRRLAERAEWPEVLKVPTGVGKTAAAVLTWLYRRRFAGEDIQRTTPRRLVYCLPMRTLVEQTYAAAGGWLEKLGLTEGMAQETVGLHLLMGGCDDELWYEHPERDAILIGTQDMLLSRALNRGYGMSRYVWPMQYALLNNDCLWVLDETQLMGVGLTTSAQLAGFRQSIPTYGTCRTLWMSATLDDEALATVDHPHPDSGWTVEQLDADDEEAVDHLLTAEKPCQRAEVAFDAESKGNYETQLAKAVFNTHQESGRLTLVVMNRVLRAQDLWSELRKLIDKEKSGVDPVLIHSRYRPGDRQSKQAAALDEDRLPNEGRIVVATQAIEAGVDLSATTLFTELAPWSSLVQRFGRCNRRGTCGREGSPPARVFWIDIDTSDSKQAGSNALPYEPDELDQARQAIEQLDDVGPHSLVDVSVTEARPIVPVIRRKDLLDLFDTTPDLSGNDLDVSRYIRDSDEADLQVYWREWDRQQKIPPAPDAGGGEIAFPAPHREELCSVPVGQFRKFLKKLRGKDQTKRLAWVWDPLDAEWQPCSDAQVYPGRTILLHVRAGGYNEDLGWTGDVKHRPARLLPPPENECERLDAMDHEHTAGDGPLTIEDHLRRVGHEAEKLRALGAEKPHERLMLDEQIPWQAVVRAAWWHDVGKAHPAFQGAMLKATQKLPEERQLTPEKWWAKSGASGYLDYQIAGASSEDQPVKRPGFRHELASALAWLQQHDGEPEADLIAYLIAAHHGKVRLSIRSLPNEVSPPSGGEERLFARGIWQGDELPPIEIGNGESSAAIDALDLRLMQLGEYENDQGEMQPSWLARMLALRDNDDLGPFRLAYLETLVRIADWRGSASKEAETP